MEVVDIIDIINNQYKLLSSDNFKSNYQILFNIIKIKNHFARKNVKQSLYLDAKQFIFNYIQSADTEDYGYDEIQLSKLEEVVKTLPFNQRLSLLYTTRRLFIQRGYDVTLLSKYITKSEIEVSIKEHRYFSAMRLWLGCSFGRLAFVYCLYVFIVGIVLLPAPIPQMEFFKVSMNDYYDGVVFNHIANTLALMCGKDGIGPNITPIGISGVILYCIGLLIFYFVFANFIFKKMEDFLNSK